MHRHADPITSQRPPESVLQRSLVAGRDTLAGATWCGSPGSRRLRGGCGGTCWIRSDGCPSPTSSAGSAVSRRRWRRPPSSQSASGGRSRGPARSAARLSDGRLVKTWAMRGTLHLLTPEDAGAFLSLIAVRPLVGAAELAALLRHDRRSRWRRSGARSARRSTVTRPHPRGARRGVVTHRGLEHLGEGLALRLGNAPEAARVAGRPLLRPEPRKSRDVHAPGGRELALGRHPRSGRGGARTRSSPTSAPTGRRPSTPSATGWPAAGSASDSFAPGS